jgi:hypothetical protein
MTKRFSIGLNLVLASVLAWVLLGQVPATGQNVQVFSVAAPTFTDRAYSEHNDGNATVAEACDAQVKKDEDGAVTGIEGGENFGDLDNGKGSYLHNVRLPDGAKVLALKLFAFDASAEDAYAYLVRKRIEKGLADRLAGYKTMARVPSSESSGTEMSLGVDNTIDGAIINNVDFYYFLELVVCETIEPFAVQVKYEP